MFIIIETLNNRFCCSLSSFVLVSEAYSDTDNHNATETTGQPVHERGIACSALYNHDQLTSSRLLVSQSIEVGHNDNSLRSPLPLAATLQEICEMEYFFFDCGCRTMPSHSGGIFWLSINTKGSNSHSGRDCGRKCGELSGSRDESDKSPGWVYRLKNKSTWHRGC